MCLSLGEVIESWGGGAREALARPPCPFTIWARVWPGGSREAYRQPTETPAHGREQSPQNGNGVERCVATQA